MLPRKIATLTRMAALRKDGYFDDVRRSASTWDEATGYYTISDEHFARIRDEYRKPATPPPPLSPWSPLPGDCIHAAAERLGFQACEGCRSARAHLNLLGARLAAEHPALDGPALAALFIERHGDEAVALVTKNAAEHPVGSLIPEWAIRKRVLGILRGAFAERTAR